MWRFNWASSSVTGANWLSAASACWIRASFSVSKDFFYVSKSTLIFSKASKEHCKMDSALPCSTCSNSSSVFKLVKFDSVVLIASREIKSYSVIKFLAQAGNNVQPGTWGLWPIQFKWRSPKQNASNIIST